MTLRAQYTGLITRCFLRFYYDTFPAVDDGLAGAAEVASLVRARGKGFNDRASDGCASSANVPHTDVHPEFPSLRIPSAVIYQFFKVISDKLIEMGQTSGKFAALWECTILDKGGRVCCNRSVSRWPLGGISELLDSFGRIVVDQLGVTKMPRAFAFF